MSGTSSSARKAEKPKTAKAPAARRPKGRKLVCAVVLGMHRSGTSALTGMLGILGCDLPKTLMPASESNERGHHESQKINDFMNVLLTSAGTRWDDWLPMAEGWYDSGRAEDFQAKAIDLFREEHGTSRLCAMKNPRICRLLPFWDQVWSAVEVEPRFALIHRNPMEVAASLEKRNGIDLHLGLLIWLRHVLEAEAGTRGRPRSFVSYPELLQNWKRTAEKLQSDLQITLPRFSLGVAAEVEEFLTPTLRHFVEAPEGIDAPIVPAWIQDAFGIMERWAARGEDKKDYVRLDRLLKAFDDAAPTFLRIVQKNGEISKAEATARESLTKTAEEKAALEKSVSDLQAKLAGLERGMQEAGRRQSDLESACAALQAERTELSRNLETSHQEIAELTRNFITLEDRLETFKSGAREKEDAAQAHLKELHATLGRKEEETEAQQRALQRLRDQLSQTQSELRQRAHEADETANGLRRADASLSGLETRNTELEDEVGQQKARVEDLLGEISRIREQGRLDQKQRFDEIASLTRRILEQDAELEARESALQQEIEGRLLPRLENSESLALRLSEVLDAILTTDIVVRRPLRRLADKRKAKLLEALGLFDPKWYREVNTDVREAGADPALHFIRYGHAEGRAASPEMARLKESRSGGVPPPEAERAVALSPPRPKESPAPLNSLQPT
ncbi:hypothetical protein [Paracoccus jeotgali]|uniref:hypothetical protein n=1 Tax=Paracoccus jeotgali TaxID=2065379 RepID=UPI0028A877CD|nr:hypothetical protein [Paracoccus jeotgali]